MEKLKEIYLSIMGDVDLTLCSFKDKIRDGFPYLDYGKFHVRSFSKALLVDGYSVRVELEENQLKKLKDDATLCFETKIESDKTLYNYLSELLQERLDVL